MTKSRRRTDAVLKAKIAGGGAAGAGDGGGTRCPASGPPQPESMPGKFSWWRTRRAPSIRASARRRMSGPGASWPSSPGHQIYPYVLRDMVIDKANQVPRAPLAPPALQTDRP
jgi:hypothetical protein